MTDHRRGHLCEDIRCDFRWSGDEQFFVHSGLWQ
jgi:hypothetical protein